MCCCIAVVLVGWQMEQLTKKAYAKINLALDVLRKRPDGYHDLRMIMQTVGIYDELTFSKRDDNEIHIAVSSAGHIGQELPCGGGNLIYRAAEEVRKRRPGCGGVNVALKKNIPVAAGMAGGSTDAAATILALDELFGLNMDPKTMSGIAVKIGADVPYCLIGGTVLCEGIGEILTPLPPMPQSRLVVVKPDISVSTAFVYGQLDAGGLTWHPDVDGMIRAVMRQEAKAVWQRLGNVLETVTIPEHPVIGRIKQTLLQYGAFQTLMSGSGPTVFAVFEDERQQQEAYRMMRAADGIEQVFMTELVADIHK